MPRAGCTASGTHTRVSIPVLFRAGDLLIILASRVLFAASNHTFTFGILQPVGAPMVHPPDNDDGLMVLRASLVLNVGIGLLQEGRTAFNKVI